MQKSMKLHEIISLNDSLLNGTADSGPLSLKELLPYKKSLKTYYENLWPRGNYVVFVATFVTNAICAGVLAPSNELGEVFDMLTNELDGEDKEHEIELLGYQSFTF